MDFSQEDKNLLTKMRGVYKIISAPGSSSTPEFINTNLIRDLKDTFKHLYHINVEMLVIALYIYDTASDKERNNELRGFNSSVCRQCLLRLNARKPISNTEINRDMIDVASYYKRLTL